MKSNKLLIGCAIALLLGLGVVLVAGAGWNPGHPGIQPSLNPKGRRRRVYLHAGEH